MPPNGQMPQQMQNGGPNGFIGVNGGKMMNGGSITPGVLNMSSQNGNNGLDWSAANNSNIFNNRVNKNENYIHQNKIFYFALFFLKHFLRFFLKLTNQKPFLKKNQKT
jgi:hypothetical protein